MSKFKFRYTLGDNPEILEWNSLCSSPITAIGQFHRWMQISGLKVVKPTEYEIVSLNLCYNSDASGLQRGIIIESPFDLPNSANPDLLLKAEEGLHHVNATMFDDTVGGKLAE